MKQQIVITYDSLTRSLEIKENDFTTFEVFGILEGAKQMIANGWLNKGDNEDGEGE